MAELYGLYINGGDPNHLQVLGWSSKINKINQLIHWIQKPLGIHQPIRKFTEPLTQAMVLPQSKWSKGLQLYQLVVSTHLKDISQNGSFPQVGVKIKTI